MCRRLGYVSWRKGRGVDGEGRGGTVCEEAEDYDCQHELGDADGEDEGLVVEGHGCGLLVSSV